MAVVTGGELVVRTLVQAGVTNVFALYGGHLETVFQGIREHGLSLVDVRHEQAGGHAAEGYARATGKLGVALATAGPGFTNIISSIGNAYLDRTPVLYICASAPLAQAESNTSQGGIDQVAVARPITKWSGQVTAARDIPRLVAQAIRIATSHPTGPVMLDLPFDISLTPVEADSIHIPKTIQVTSPLLPSPEAVDQALALLAQAERPVIMVGEGAYQSGASEVLRTFIEATGVPAFCDYEAQGLVPSSHPLYGGTFYSMTDLAAAGAQPDMVLALGVRFGKSTLGAGRKLVPDSAQIVQVDVDPKEIGRLRDVAVAMVADSREALLAMNARRGNLHWTDQGGWRDLVRDTRAARTRLYDQAKARTTAPIHPYQATAAVMDAVDDEVILVGDGAEAHHWLIEALRREIPGRFFTHGILGGTGLGLGLAMGVQAAHRDKRVVCVTGDGAVGFALAEFDSMARNKLPIVTLVMNNRCWGATKHFQEFISGPGKAIANDLGDARYDLAAVALGCHGEYVTEPSELAPALTRALASGKPACINVEIEFAAFPPESEALTHYE